MRWSHPYPGLPIGTHATSIIVVALLYISCGPRPDPAAPSSPAKAGVPDAYPYKYAVVDVTADECTSNAAGEGLRISDATSVDPNVMKGMEYECAALELTGFSTLVLPADAIVDVSMTDSVVLYMAKEVHFLSIPTFAVSIPEALEKMGIAWKAEGEKLFIGTYGEWDSLLEGGTSIELIVEASGGIEVERDDRLSGGNSIVTATGQPEGWHVIQSVPDEDWATWSATSEEGQEG